MFARKRKPFQLSGKRFHGCPRLPAQSGEITLPARVIAASVFCDRRGAEVGRRNNAEAAFSPAPVAALLHNHHVAILAAGLAPCAKIIGIGAGD